MPRDLSNTLTQNGGDSEHKVHSIRQMFFKFKKGEDFPADEKVMIWTDATKISPLNGPKFHGIYTVSNGTRYTQLQEMAAAQERPIAAILMDTLCKVLPILIHVLH